MDNIIFQDPYWFLALLLIPVLLFMRGRMGQKAALLFSSITLFGKYGSRARNRSGKLLFLLRTLALLAFITALARPQLGQGFEEMESSGIDIVLTVDVSLSMQARDFSLNKQQVSRLDAAKDVIQDFIQKRPNDRIGLIAFARYPYLVSPITMNHDWLLKNLKDNVEIGRVEDGTAIGSAVGMSVNRLRDLKDAKSRVVILLTDGVNNSGDVPPVAAAEAAATYKTKVYTIGIGSDHPVTIYKRDRNGRLIRDIFGSARPLGKVRPVDTETLHKIAELSSGRFFRAKDTDELEEIYAEIDALEKTKVKLRKYERYQELFHWPAYLGIAFLLLEILLAHTLLRRLP